MKKAIVLTAVLGLTSVGWAEGTTRQAVDERLQHAGEVLHEVMNAPDKGIPDEVLDHAKCIAVVPHMLKGGFVFGAENGRGVATCRTANGWSAPAFFTITGGSWGLQLGGQAIDIVMVVTNDQGMQHLLESKFKLGAEASAAAGPVGRDAGADTDWKMKAEVLTYSRARGLFAGIDLSGASISQDKDSTRILYGKMVPFSVILRGKTAAPNGSNAFLTAVRKYSHQAKEQGE